MIDQLLADADRVSDDVLAPARGEVDRSGLIPPGHFDAMAESGLFGAALLADPLAFAGVVEALARGCLSTTFVWLQHHGLARRLAMPGIDTTLEPLARALRAGQTRAGVVQAGLLPGSPLLTARRDEGSKRWLLDGFSPWCTGWGMVEELLVAARLIDDHESVAWFCVRASEQPGFEVRRLELQAVDATDTVSLRFDGVAVEPVRFLGTDAYAKVGHAAGTGLRPNGSLALGLAVRCARALEAIGTVDTDARAERLHHRIDLVRAGLDAADDHTMPERRVDAALLAVDAAVGLVAGQGAAAAIRGSEGEQAMREATFLLVFGSRPSIKQQLLRRL